MGENDAVRVAQAYIEGINSHSLDTMAELLADDLRVEVATGAECPMGKEDFLAYNENYLNAFPDVHFDTTLLVVEGDHVVAHWFASGTQTKVLGTPQGGIIMPTGKSASASGCFTFELSKGKIQRVWAIWDMATLLAQLGLLPTILENP
jgi:steroid delta-isomerase-like uncharacterized protein